MIIIIKPKGACNLWCKYVKSMDMHIVSADRKTNEFSLTGAEKNWNSSQKTAAHLLQLSVSLCVSIWQGELEFQLSFSFRLGFNVRTVIQGWNKCLYLYYFSRYSFTRTVRSRSQKIVGNPDISEAGTATCFTFLLYKWQAVHKIGDNYFFFLLNNLSDDLSVQLYSTLNAFLWSCVGVSAYTDCKKGIRFIAFKISKYLSNDFKFLMI